MLCGESSSHLSIGTDQRLTLAVLLASNRPVDKEEVHVVELETLERVVEGPEDVIVAVQVVPDLGAHEDVLTLDGGVGLEEIMDGVPDLTLIEVEPRAVKLTVAYLEGSRDGGVGLALGALVGEGTEANGGHFHAVGQCVSLSR